MGCIMVMVVSASVAAGMLLGEAFNRPQIPTGLLITIPSGNCVEPTPGQVLVVTVIHDGKPRLGECTTYTTQWKKRPGR